MRLLNINNKQIDRISEIFSNVGLLILASMVFPIFTSVDKKDPYFLWIGVILFFICVFESLFLIGGDSGE